MSAKNHVWRMKRRTGAKRGDIRYRGPISYRAFEILGWLCVLLAVVIVIMTVVSSISSKSGAGQGLPKGILQYPVQLSALLLLIAGISRSMRDGREYKQQLLTYLGLAGILAAGSALVFQRTVMAAIDRLFLEPKEIVPQLEKTFSELTGIGFIAYNVFIDIFLLILLFFFVNVQPRRVFTGKWVVILRACAALPIACAVACMWVKYQAICGNRVMPFWCYPILTVKPLPAYGLFLFLAIRIKGWEKEACRDGGTIEAYQSSLRSRRSSLRFGITLAVALAVTAVVDNLLQYGAAQLLMKSHAPENVEALAWGLRAAKRVGFGGESLVLLAAAPIMLLYSFNRVPRWRIFSILAPLIAIALVVLLWQGNARLGTGQYIVEGKVSKLSLTGIQQMMDYVKKVSAVVSALFKA